MIELRLVALEQLKSPVICCTPLMAMVPVADEEMITSPLNLEQLAMAAASADVVMVIGPSHCALRLC